MGYCELVESIDDLREVGDIQEAYAPSFITSCITTDNVDPRQVVWPHPSTRGFVLRRRHCDHSLLYPRPYDPHALDTT